MIILETKRLLLRHLEPADLHSLFALYSDPEISRFIPDAPRTLAEAKEELDWFLHGHPKHPELGLWATIHKETNQFIGRCGLLPWTIDGQDEVEVAYLIAKSHWGQGLATEAARAIMARLDAASLVTPTQFAAATDEELRAVEQRYRATGGR